MDFPFAFLFGQIFYRDILIVVSVAMFCMVGITAWLIYNRYSIGYILTSWVLFLVFLTLGYTRAIREEQLYHLTWTNTFQGITQSFASATEAMGHAKITRQTEQDDPLYQNILNLHSSWCRDFPMINYVYTLRLRENETEKVNWIVSCPTDVDGNGRIEGPKEVGEELYKPYDEWFEVYRKAFDGEVALDENLHSLEFGEFATSVAPLRDPDNPDYIEAIIGIDFDLKKWNRMLAQIQFASAQFLALILFLYLTALYFIALLHRTILRISETNRELIAAKRAADAAARAKSDFLANMSHEIRTPMNALVGFTEILTQRLYQNCGPQEREESEGIMEIIRENGRLLLTIINDILDFSKIEANLLQVESVPISVKQIIEEIWQTEMPNVMAKHLDFSVKYKEPIPEQILGDPTRLRQILLNLIGNAIKFTEKGSVIIHCETFSPPHAEPRFRSGSGITHENSAILHDPHNPYPGSTMLKIDVIDTGIGIAPTQLEYLFQPFTQLDNSSTRRFGGTGLGLSIAKRLAHLMDGDITATSELGVGSTFTLILHVYLPSEHHSGEPEMGKGPTRKGSTLEPGLEIRPPISREFSDNEHESLSANHPLRQARILLVEDMAVNQLVISTQLRDAGAMVEIAGNGELGIQKIVQDSDNGLFFDVVLMDMQMPVMDGYEATTYLRQQNYTRPIIAITAHALTGDREKTIEAGCDDYIAKPVDRNVLINTIKKYLK